MALVTCPDCSKEISDAAPACPGCGRPAPSAAAPHVPGGSRAFAAGIALRSAVRRSGHVHGGGALALAAIGIAIFLGWCALRTPTPDATATAAPIAPLGAVEPQAAVPTVVAVAPETLPPDDAAKDVAAVLRGFYPLSCKSVGANNDWAKCHDETKGFDNVLRCAQAARAKAKAATTKIPADSARSTCGKEITSASRGVVVTTAKMFDDLVAWLEKHRGQLAGPMVNATLGDALDPMDIGGDEPRDSLPAYDGASYRHVMGVECTKMLFQCGVANNVCWINKVADRLGVACDAAENKTDSPLSVRATGTRIRPAAAATATPAGTPAKAPAVAPNVDRLRSCCGQLRIQAKALGASPEAGFLTQSSFVCDQLAAQAGPDGRVPEKGVLSTALAGRNMPAACAGF